MYPALLLFSIRTIKTGAVNELECVSFAASHGERSEGW